MESYSFGPEKKGQESSIKRRYDVTIPVLR